MLPRHRVVLFHTLAALLFLQPAFPEQLEDRWDRILSRHTAEGYIEGVPLTVVDYQSIQTDADWSALIEDLETASEPSNANAKKAFWINAYNILAIKVVLSKYPIDSIKDVSPWYRTVWGMDAGIIAGKMRSLGEIEHEILRPMGDPLIHAGIVCASVSCPDLRREAYRSKIVSEQLSQQMSGFLKNPHKGAHYDRKKDVLFVSKIFDLFEKDFKNSSGSLRAFLLEYLPKDVVSNMASNAKIRYMDYDWSLNDARRSHEK